MLTFFATLPFAAVSLIKSYKSEIISAGAGYKLGTFLEKRAQIAQQLQTQEKIDEFTKIKLYLVYELIFQNFLDDATLQDYMGTDYPKELDLGTDGKPKSVACIYKGPTDRGSFIQNFHAVRNTALQLEKAYNHLLLWGQERDYGTLYSATDGDLQASTAVFYMNLLKQISSKKFFTKRELAFLRAIVDALYATSLDPKICCDSKLALALSSAAEEVKLAIKVALFDNSRTSAKEFLQGLRDESQALIKNVCANFIDAVFPRSSGSSTVVDYSDLSTSWGNLDGTLLQIIAYQVFGFHIKSLKKHPVKEPTGLLPKTGFHALLPNSGALPGVSLSQRSARMFLKNLKQVTFSKGEATFSIKGKIKYTGRSGISCNFFFFSKHYEEFMVCLEKLSLDIEIIVSLIKFLDVLIDLATVKGDQEIYLGASIQSLATLSDIIKVIYSDLPKDLEEIATLSQKVLHDARKKEQEDSSFYAYSVAPVWKWWNGMSDADMAGVDISNFKRNKIIVNSQLKKSLELLASLEEAAQLFKDYEYISTLPDQLVTVTKTIQSSLSDPESRLSALEDASKLLQGKLPIKPQPKMPPKPLPALVLKPSSPTISQDTLRETLKAACLSLKNNLKTTIGLLEIGEPLPGDKTAKKSKKDKATQALEKFIADLLNISQTETDWRKLVHEMTKDVNKSGLLAYKRIFAGEKDGKPIFTETLVNDKIMRDFKWGIIVCQKKIINQKKVGDEELLKEYIRPQTTLEDLDSGEVPEEFVYALVIASGIFHLARTDEETLHFWAPTLLGLYTGIDTPPLQKILHRLDEDFLEAYDYLRIVYEVPAPKDPQAQFNLALCYFRHHTPEYVTQGKRLLQKAAEQGHPEAQYKFGCDQNYYQSRVWFEKAAKQEHAEAQYRLGCGYSCGNYGIKEDAVQAVIWFKKAALQGHKNSQYELGECYKHGKGTAKDATLAAKWYTEYYQSTLKTPSMYDAYRVGYLHENGLGVPQDKKKARWYYEEAVFRTNDTRAYERLQILVLEADGVEKYIKKFVREDDGAYRLGYLYENSLGVPKDNKMAYYWYFQSMWVKKDLDKEAAAASIKRMSESGILEAIGGKAFRMDCLTGRFPPTTATPQPPASTATVIKIPTKLPINATLKTAGEGDCAFHATLGIMESDGWVRCQDVATERGKVADYVRGCTKGSEAYQYICEYIGEIIGAKDETRYHPMQKEMKKLHEDYQTHCKDSSTDKAWEAFYKVLIKHDKIIKNIHEHYNSLKEEPLSGKSELDQVREKFQKILDHKMVPWNLRQAIADNKALSQAFAKYNKITQTSFPWETAIATQDIEVFAQFIQQDGECLIGAGLAMIAYANDLTVHYYPGPGSQPVTYNAGQDKQVAVEHNSIDHFSRVLPQRRTQKIIDILGEIGMFATKPQITTLVCDYEDDDSARPRHFSI